MNDFIGRNTEAYIRNSSLELITINIDLPTRHKVRILLESETAVISRNMLTPLYLIMQLKHDTSYEATLKALQQ